MKSFALNSVGDLDFSGGSFLWSSSKQAISQKILSILRRSKQEWFLHPQDGIDWLYLVQQSAESSLLFSYAITQALHKWIPNLQIIDLQTNFSYPSKTLYIHVTGFIDSVSYSVQTHV